MRSAFCLVLLAAGAAYGQAVSPPKPPPIDVPLPPTAPRDSLQLELRAAPRPALRVDAPVTVRAFRVTGATVVPAGELETALESWTGRPLAAEDLAKAAAAVAARLRNAGLLLAEAYVPEQAIQDGVVEIAVFEGRIGAVRLDVAPDARLRRAVAERFLAAMRGGELIRGDNVEHSLLLLNDLPGVRVDAKVVPGSAAGSADFLVGVADDGGAVSGSLTLDNGGLDSTGPYRADLVARWRSPLGLGDQLAARLLGSDTGGQQLASLVYGVPVNGLGTRVGVRYAEQRYRLGREFAELEAHGDSRATSLLAGHPIVRRSDRNVNVVGSYTDLQFSDRRDAVGLVSDTVHRVMGLGAAADLRDGLLGGGLTALQVQYLRGKVTLETPAAAELDAGPGGLNVAGDFSTWRLRLQRAQALTKRTSVHATVVVQTASKNLDAGPELALGGPEAVRAYPAGELYADEGTFGRLELRQGFVFYRDWQTTFSAFGDWAHARINKNPLPGDPANVRSLAGYGLGLHQALGADLAVQLWVAWRDGPPATSEADRSPRGWFSIVWNFQ
jgi:hemolysin activation/secretion protein